MTVWLFKIQSYPIPAPISFFSDYHVSDLVRFSAFATLNVVFALNHNEYSSDYTLYGWLTIANGGLALLLAPRTNLFSILGRIPSPILLQYHRWIGTATVAHATVHISYNIQHYIATDQLASSFIAARIRVGIMSWICLAVIFITAFPVVRRKAFEVFYYAHFLFFIFVVGALYHTTKGPEFLLPGLGLWVIDRAIRFIYNFRRIQVDSVSFYEGGLTKLKISGVQTTSPAQIIFAQIPAVSFLNWHPFTVASADNDVNKKAVIAIRGLGGFTTKVQNAVESSKEQPGHSDAFNKIRIDGPYGVGRIQWGYHPLTVLVAGGIGITPGISIASSIIKAASTGSMQQAAHIHLLWVVKEECHINWWSEELDELCHVASASDNQINLDVTIHVTKAAAQDGLSMEEKAWKTLPGRPDVKSWLGNVKANNLGNDAALNVCGPRSLILETRKGAVALNDQNMLFYVEEEVFEF